MKAGLKIALAIAAIVILAGTIFFFWQRGPHLPRAQTPQPPGMFIPKNQLVFAGYKTPEAAFESAFWAWMNGDYDAFIASFPPDEQAKMRKEIPNPKLFKSEMQRGEFSVKDVEIMARKKVSSDKVELKIEMVFADSRHNSATNIVIWSTMRTGREWKSNEAISGYSGSETNWDNSGDVVTFAN